MNKNSVYTFTMKLATTLSNPFSSKEPVISMITSTTLLTTTNWSIFLGLLPELQASQPAKSSCLFPLTMVEPRGFNYTLQVSDEFDDMVIYNNHYNFSMNKCA